MPEPGINKRSLIIAFFVSLLLVLLIFLHQLTTDREKIVFCDVGQGDGAYIRLKNDIDIVVDAGPDKSFLTCLGRHMPFWDKKIELAILSHPNVDHYGGFMHLVNRYKISRFVTVDTELSDKSYDKLIDCLNSKLIPVQFKAMGDKFWFEGAHFVFFWPPTGFDSLDDNDFSSIFLFKYGKFKTVFTGDASPVALGKAVILNRKIDLESAKSVDVLKVPHHGSKNGLTYGFLKLANPMTAVISVGKYNNFGHPSQTILDLLKAKNVNIKRTDINGDVIINLEE